MECTRLAAALLITRLGEQLPRPRQVSMSSKRSKTVPSFSAFRGSIVQEKMADVPEKILA